MPATTVPAVELQRAGKRFGGVVALDDVSLTIDKGEFLSLLGPSGCGKSTTLNLIGGFEDATSGEVLIDGRTVTGMPPHMRPVNTVFQSYALFPHMTVAENVAFGLRMKGVPKAERGRSVAEMLRMVSLAGYEDRRPAQLSGGQRQRVALARALVNHPSVLLLDEPLGALDLKLRKQMQAELTRLQRQVGITFVYVTHDQEEAMAMSDRIAVMDHGRLLQVGTPAEIYNDPQHRFVMDFIGAANELPGRIAGRDGDEANVELLGLGHVRARTGRAGMPGDDVSLLIRPEKLRLAGTAAGDGNPALRGRIARIALMGFVIHVTVRLASGQEVLVYRLGEAADAGAELPREGQEIFLSWDPADARVFPVDRPAPGDPGTQMSDAA